MAATGGATAHAESISGASVLTLFSATLFLSAFLLFSVQPFFAKMVLPRLGGSPAVWSVAMVFFQTMLLLGYAYAHLLTSRLSLRAAACLHGLVLAAAFAALPIAVPAGWDQPPEAGQAVWLLGLFAVSVGLPFFAVSANAPLLQAWFARTGHPHAADPYFLYGASNVGSFASLILFIVLFEPFFTVREQAAMWSTGFFLLAMLIGLGAVSALRTSVAAAAASPDETARANPLSRPGMWMLLAFVPSGLLVAVTAHISTDVAAAPFLWVAPLALFLLTFVVAFRRTPVIGVATLSRIIPFAGAFAVVAIFLPSLFPVWLGLTLHLAFFFVAALFCHARLFELRPQASRLTGFYLWMSLGGVLGGAFASLAAPFLFDWVAEYLLLIVAAMLLRPELRESPRDRIVAFLFAASFVGAIIFMVGPLLGPALFNDRSNLAYMMAAVVMAAALIQFLSQPAFMLCMLLAVPLGFLHAASGGALFHERTFFGVVRVTETADGRFRLMTHGTTMHGAMALGGESGRPEPISYYHESGGIASALRAMQQRRGGAIERGGLVGLGTGSLICHAAPGERWTAFEIDRAVVKAATDPALFRFMPECGADVPVIIGDARLTLADEPDGAYDFLLIDAFSSDSIPVHLMTREAIRLYMAKVKQDGIVAMHISNRYLELESVLAAVAAGEGLAIRSGYFAGSDGYVSASRVAVLARDAAMFGAINDDPRWREVQARGTAAWTDDFSNVFTALLRML